MITQLQLTSNKNSNKYNNDNFQDNLSSCYRQIITTDLVSRWSVCFTNVQRNLSIQQHEYKTKKCSSSGMCGLSVNAEEKTSQYYAAAT